MSDYATLGQSELGLFISGTKFSPHVQTCFSVETSSNVRFQDDIWKHLEHFRDWRNFGLTIIWLLNSPASSGKFTFSFSVPTRV